MPMNWNPIDAAKGAAVNHVNNRVSGYIGELEEKLRERGMLGENESIRNQKGELDAIRHAYVLGRLTQDYGYQMAKFMGNEHEKRNPNPPDQQRMDYHNNDVGARFGNQVINEAHQNRLKPGETIEDRLFERVLRGARDGELITDPSQTRPRVGQLRSDAGDGALVAAAPDARQLSEIAGNPKVTETVAALNRTPGVDPMNIDGRNVMAMAMTADKERFSPNFAGKSENGEGFLIRGQAPNDPGAAVLTVSKERMQQPIETSLAGIEQQRAQQTAGTPSNEPRVLAQEPEVKRGVSLS
jgi:hypothetical protein